jgi:hypothetical protein
VSHLVYYQRDDESEAFNAAVRDQMRRTSRERARKEPAGVDWAAFRRRAWEIFIMYVIVADIGLMLIAARGERPVQMSFPGDVTSTSAPHPATTGSHP